MKTTDQIESKRITFSQFYCLIFVLFCLYLMGDAFSRWDGFSYYASLSEFIPSIALALILWTIVSFCTAALLWSFFRLITWIGSQQLKISIEHLLSGAFIFLILGILVWKIKKTIWPDVQTTFAVKLAVLCCVTFLSVYLSWLVRGRTGQWLVAVRERITPLVWLFAILLFLSVPIVAYHTWLKGGDKSPEENSIRPSDRSGSRPNIILVTFDALAAQNMSVYGYHRETTPFISSWAQHASLFTAAEAASNFTAPTTASLMTGKRVWTHQTYHIEGTAPLNSHVESLPALLKESGYFNIALVVNPFASVSILGMSGSFDIAPPASEFGSPASLFGWKFGFVDIWLYRAFGEKIKLHNWILKNDFILSKVINVISRNISVTTVPPHKAMKRLMDILDNSPPQPFFAWIHIFPPHDPYLPPGPFRGTFTKSAEMRSYKPQEALIEKSYTYLFQHQPYPKDMQRSVSLMRDYYDEFVRYIDNQFEVFVNELEQRNPGNTVILLSSDHGESFEHGYFTHAGPYLYEQVTHVPLIIKTPWQKSGRIISDVVEQIDIAATIADLANISHASWMEGRSLVPLMRGEKLAERPAFSMNLQGNRSHGHQIRSGSIAVWEGDFKLIHYLDRDESLLFNLREDPSELNNLFSLQPELGEHLLGLIMRNLERANKRLEKGTEHIVPP